MTSTENPTFDDLMADDVEDRAIERSGIARCFRRTKQVDQPAPITGTLDEQPAERPTIDVRTSVGRILNGHLDSSQRWHIGDVFATYHQLDGDELAALPAGLLAAIALAEQHLTLPSTDAPADVDAYAVLRVDLWRVRCSDCDAPIGTPCRGVGTSVVHADRVFGALLAWAVLVPDIAAVIDRARGAVAQALEGGDDRG